MKSNKAAPMSKWCPSKEIYYAVEVKDGCSYITTSVFIICKGWSLTSVKNHCQQRRCHPLLDFSPCSPKGVLLCGSACDGICHKIKHSSYTIIVDSSFKFTLSLLLWTGCRPFEMLMLIRIHIERWKFTKLIDKGWHKTRGIANKFLIWLKAQFMRWNPYVVVWM